MAHNEGKNEREGESERVLRHKKRTLTPTRARIPNKNANGNAFFIFHTYKVLKIFACCGRLFQTKGLAPLGFCWQKLNKYQKAFSSNEPGRSHILYVKLAFHPSNINRNSSVSFPRIPINKLATIYLICLVYL